VRQVIEFSNTSLRQPSQIICRFRFDCVVP